MQGFNCGLPMLGELMDKCDIVAAQEHWLRECELGKLMTVDKRFDSVASSAMGQAVCREITVGRPFGGVAIL